MTAHTTLPAERFEADRPRLRAVAHRMLGSLSEADDAVQETWLRASRADVGDVANLSGWLTTEAGRVCLNMLRSRGRRPETPLDAETADAAGFAAVPAESGDPEEEALLADSVGVALSSSWRRWPRPSAWRSSCTTCSPCRSTTSPR
ncbi:DNA-directed RNA polymerase specialized sigma24 family protein [Streptomyces sp. B4I13]|nr:DNA-directed RNA polymerase specialized sigma24 family protein [Streptomyces sp. B4I13]